MKNSLSILKRLRFYEILRASIEIFFKHTDIPVM